MDRIGRRGNVLKNDWIRMDCKGQWEYGVKQCASYGENEFRVSERGREEQKEGDNFKQLVRVKVNVRSPDVERVSGEESVKGGDKSGIAWKRRRL
jgi:hypothetical protein